MVALGVMGIGPSDGEKDGKSYYRIAWSWCIVEPNIPRETLLWGGRSQERLRGHRFENKGQGDEEVYSRRQTTYAKVLRPGQGRWEERV
jgi:hypothetical protein